MPMNCPPVQQGHEGGGWPGPRSGRTVAKRPEDLLGRSMARISTSSTNSQPRSSAERVALGYLWSARTLRLQTARETSSPRRSAAGLLALQLEHDRGRLGVGGVRRRRRTGAEGGIRRAWSAGQQRPVTTSPASNGSAPAASASSACQGPIRYRAASRPRRPQPRHRPRFHVRRAAQEDAGLTTRRGPRRRFSPSRHGEGDCAASGVGCCQPRREGGTLQRDQGRQGGTSGPSCVVVQRRRVNRSRRPPGDGRVLIGCT